MVQLRLAHERPYTPTPPAAMSIRYFISGKHTTTGKSYWEQRKLHKVIDKLEGEGSPEVGR